MTAPLPTDTAQLQALVQSQQQQLAQLQQQLDEQQRKYQTLHEQLRLYLHRQYAPSSEQTPSEQLSLFDEAEQLAPEGEDLSAPVTEVQGHQRKRRGRRALPKHLPRVEVIHDLEDKHCPHDGELLKPIGREISEQLDIIPAQIRVIRHVRLKYACEHCEQGVYTAPPPVQILPKSLATAGLLAHIAISKYADALPLYRQSSILKRAGVNIPRATLAHWMIKVGEKIQPLIDLLREQLRVYDLIQMDETPVQVLKEPNRAATAQSYMWVQRGRPPDAPVILFDYAPSRSASVPKRLLGPFKGILQTDGYEAYDAVARTNSLVAVGCWAHVRRKFDQALKVQTQLSEDSLAAQALAQIRILYRIERELKEVDAQTRQQQRQQQTKPRLDQLRQWLDRYRSTVTPTSTLGKALAYMGHQWPKLIRFCEDGRIAIDNNAAERAIRPFVVGRKNWLFSASVAGANASANLYSLIETAKANGLEPYSYLRYVFTRLPEVKTDHQRKALLAHNLTPVQIQTPFGSQ